MTQDEINQAIATGKAGQATPIPHAATLRDQFAMAALPFAAKEMMSCDLAYRVQATANLAYEFARAMLTARHAEAEDGI